MSRIEGRVRSLVSEDPEMREAVDVVLERAEGGEVKWVDVRDDLTSGQWGRLIEQGVLVDGESGFRIADAESTREAMEEASTDYTKSNVEAEDVETTKWSKWDKGAALVTVGFFVGYTWQPVRDVIGSGMNAVLGPLNGLLPFYAVIMVVALATGLYSTLLRASLMDMEKMGKYQSRMKDIQRRRKEAKEAGDEAAMEAIQEEQMEAMGEQMGMFKEQFRPMVWIMFLTIPAFLWMYWIILDGNGSLGELVIPLAGSVSWTQGLLGPIQVWIVWYFLCSMAFTQIIQKGLNISMSPSSS